MNRVLRWVTRTTYPADRQRLLVNALVEDDDIGSRAEPSAADRAPITLLVNWPSLLRQ